MPRDLDWTSQAWRQHPQGKGLSYWLPTQRGSLQGVSYSEETDFWDTHPALGRVLVSNGSRSVAVPYTPLFQPSPQSFSLSAWYVNTSSATNSPLISRWLSSFGTEAWILRASSSAAGLLTFNLKTEAGSVEIKDTTATNDGKEHNAVATYDGVTARLYRDAILVASASITGNMIAPSDTLYLMKYHPSLSGDFTGLLADIRFGTWISQNEIWNRWASQSRWSMPPVRGSKRYFPTSSQAINPAWAESSRFMGRGFVGLRG